MEVGLLSMYRGNFMTEKELKAMAEGKRLGIGSKEFLQRHNDIMRMADGAQQNGGKPDGTGSEDGNA